MQLTPATRLRAIAADERGVSAVEFALLLPVLVLLYFGLVELTQGFMTHQRAAHVASAIGDLTSQSSSLTSAEVSDIFAVGNAVMYPYPTQTLQMRVSSLSADARGRVTVNWSQGQGMTALAKGAVISDAPTNVINAGESAIMAESQYTYSSAFKAVMPRPVTFSEKYYLRPRGSSPVACADC